MSKGFGRKYPRGRISADDDGEMSMGLAHDPATNTLVFNFFKPIQWFGLGPDELSSLIMQLARHLSRMKGVSVTVVIGDEQQTEEGDRP